MANEKYIKVTPKDGKPVIILAANRAFYAKQKDTKIEIPTQEEINAAFPYEKKNAESNKGIENIKKQLETVTAELADEKTAHAETQKQLETVTAELEKAKKEIEKLSKKQ
ncbi:hypothetical protein FACS189434_08010 [Bacteroidia bacterium]|nr:hypothetical protein FACS189434_08010 [Bacteroidia bacterium]